jgi:dinuclear metal center YbgI/SA1388 family protein
MPTVADVADYLEQFAPTRRAAEWDNVGLILGERSAGVTRILTCLSVTPPVVEEAIASGVNLIVTHHPMLFRPVQKLTDATPEGRMVVALLRAGIAVYSPHTSFDNCAGGINDQLAEMLGLTDVRPLRSYEAARQCKVVVFVPDSDLAKVSDAMFAAGVGNIGQYSHCSFRLAGTGTFFGSDAANPAVGVKGRREEVSEWRLEAICQESQVEKVVGAIRGAHSYEEPAYDIYPLRAGREAVGEGRVCRLTAVIDLEEFAQKVRAQLKGGPVQVIGERTRLVRSVALACGAAGEFLRDAISERADVFLTGEARFHDCLFAQTQGIAMILAGHYATERHGVVALAEQLRSAFPEIQSHASQTETDPINWF